MSREKFEEHAKMRGLLLTKWDDGVYISDQTREAAFAWSAGRESMRDEAIDKLGDFDATKCAQIVAGIEP